MSADTSSRAVGPSLRTARNASCRFLGAEARSQRCSDGNPAGPMEPIAAIASLTIQSSVAVSATRSSVGIASAAAGPIRPSEMRAPL